MLHTTTLRNGNPIPLIGFGTYLLKGPSTPSLVATAIQTGYRHIDTAAVYRNETAVGKGIRQAMKSEGLSREDLFVTTKLWPGNTTWKQEAKNFQTTQDALQTSLDKLRLEYVDLYLIHAPFNPDLRLETWRALVTLQERGLARAIGVSNYNETHILEIEKAGLPLPDANQIELHPWSQKPELVRFLKEKSILPIAYSSLVPLSTWRAKEGQKSGKTAAMQAESEQPETPFKAIAVKHGVSAAQVLLKWGLQKGYPILPKSENPDRIRENFDLFTFMLDEEDMELMESLDQGPGVAWGSGDPLLKY